MENENKKINHIAIAVPNVKEAALKWQQALNIKKSEIIILEEHGVKVVFFRIFYFFYFVFNYFFENIFRHFEFFLNV